MSLPFSFVFLSCLCSPRYTFPTAVSTHRPNRFGMWLVRHTLAQSFRQSLVLVIRTLWRSKGFLRQRSFEAASLASSSNSRIFSDFFQDPPKLSVDSTHLWGKKLLLGSFFLLHFLQEGSESIVQRRLCHGSAWYAAVVQVLVLAPVLVLIPVLIATTKV